MERRAEGRRQPLLDAVAPIPGYAFEEWVDEADQQERGRELRVEPRALRNAARNDGRDSGSEGQEEEELGQLIAAFFRQRLRPGEKTDAVGQAVPPKK